MGADVQNMLPGNLHDRDLPETLEPSNNIPRMHHESQSERFCFYVKMS